MSDFLLNSLSILFDLLAILGSLGLFIYGMKIMSEGLQKLAGDGLRSLLKGMTSTRLSGVLTGTVVTSIIQSSSATTVMVVSFVNAGLLTLSESFGVIMGANIGTTITAWLVAYVGFKVNIVPIAMVLIGVTFPLLFVRRERLKFFAEFVMGFGILFIGLSYLKDSVPDVKSNPEILSFVNTFTQSGYLSIIFFIILGTLLTVVVQSSSASTAITLVMLSNGWIEFDLAAAMVLGENIGTTITANIAAMIGNVYAKRAARFHTLFNVIGVIWMLLAFKFFVPFIESTAGTLGLVGVKDDGTPDMKMSLALFHTAFNVLNVLILIGFVPYLEKLVIRLQPSKGSDDERHILKYINSGMMSTAELSLAEARKKLVYFVKVIDKMAYSLSAVLMGTADKPDDVIARIKEREELTDEIELELTDYLTKVAESDMTHHTSEKVRDMMAIANDLERMADIYFMMAKNYERMRKKDIKYSADVLEELRALLEVVYGGLQMTKVNIEMDSDKLNIKPVLALEQEIKATRKKLVRAHYDRLEKNVYSPIAGVIYLDFVKRTERIAAHIANVNEALAGIR